MLKPSDSISAAEAAPQRRLLAEIDEESCLRARTAVSIATALTDSHEHYCIIIIIITVSVATANAIGFEPTIASTCAVPTTAGHTFTHIACLDRPDGSFRGLP